MSTQTPPGILLYADMWPALSKLSDKQFRDVIQALVSLLGSCDKPELDAVTDILFEAFKPRQEFNFRRYEEVSEKRRKAGAKGGAARVANQANQANQASQANQVNQANQPNINQTKTNETKPREKKNTLPPTPSGGTGGGKIPFTEYTSDFNDWYDNYPSKIGKKPAFEAWRCLRNQGLLPPRDDLFEAVDIQKKHYGWSIPGREQFAPKPADWLLQRRWEDECPDTPYVPPQRDTAPPQRAQASSGGFDMERQRAINAQVLADLAEEENQKRLQEKTIEN